WGQTTLPDAVDRSRATIFSGYDTLEDEGVVLYLVSTDDQSMPVLLSEAEAGAVVTVITDRTPFYAAAGGQVGDIGSIGTEQARLTVQDTTKTVEGIYFHLSLVEEGSIRVGEVVKLQVDPPARLDTARNHTTTHLLHKALKLVVGDHVAQAGSAVSPERLRFDFSHFQPLTQAEKQKVEALVNEEILRNDPVVTEIKSIEQARREGAVALFDEKYGDTVRVVSVGSFSKELCGGTHLHLTAEACQFRLISESGIASGIRRIEGVTGSSAWLLAREQDQLLKESAATLRVQENELPGRLGQLIERIKKLEKELAEEHKEKLKSTADNLTDQLVVIGAITTLVTAIQVADIAQLRAAADRIRDRLDDYMIVLGAAIEGKAAWVAMASDKAVKAGLHAGNLIREAARLTGGGGGGKPEMAQAGGKNPDMIPQALQEIKKHIQEKLC
ncbi:MAG: DHHA1 domain-containing protein, partial [Bacillota bacterium]|nr:DHHA1 domain-containing protein [Bacillota bacterium]